MNKHINNSLEYLSFESLDKLNIVKNVFTTRLGGVSKGYYSSMNLGFTNGDDSQNVRDNFNIIASEIGITPDHIVLSKQTHTTNVHVVTSNDYYNDGQLHLPEYDNIDGLITNIKGVALATFYADCVPLYFVDPCKEVIGLSHSGWRGTVNKMGEITVKTMHEKFGCKPKDIYCGIGPSICQSCYEVSEDVADEFATVFNIDKEHISSISDIIKFGSKTILLKGNTQGKYYLNLWEANKQILLNAGIEESHIECAELCTCCNSDWLFSHRATNGKRGNLGAFLMLQ